MQPTPPRTSVLSSSSSVILTKCNSLTIWNRHISNHRTDSFVCYSCICNWLQDNITLRIVVGWLNIKEALVLHLLNITFCWVHSFPFAGLLVIIKGAGLRKCASTQVARVWAFSCVCPTMSSKGRDVWETSSATSASMRLLSCVGSLVQLQVGLPCKCLVTLVTLERFQTWMDQHVLCQLAWPFENRLALRTLVQGSFGFIFPWRRASLVFLKQSSWVKFCRVFSKLGFSRELLVAKAADDTDGVFMQVLMSLPRRPEVLNIVLCLLHVFDAQLTCQ